MTPQQAYDWLSPKLSHDERQALDVIFSAVKQPDAATEFTFGCHCDLEEGHKPDGCVLDYGRPEDCIHASSGVKKESCQYWLPIQVQR